MFKFTDYHPAKFYYTREGPASAWLTKLHGFINRSQCLIRCKRKRTKCSLVTDWEGMAKECETLVHGAGVSAEGQGSAPLSWVRILYSEPPAVSPFQSAAALYGSERVRGWCHTAPCKWQSCLRTFDYKPQIIKRTDVAIQAHLKNILLNGGARWEVSNVSMCREYPEQRNPESKGDRDVERPLGSPHTREQS